MKQKLSVQQLVSDLKYDVINKEQADLNRTINGLSLDRKGLELSGLVVDDYYHSKIVGWGTKERIFLEAKKTEKERLAAYETALTKKTPLLFLSNNFKDKLKTEIVNFASDLQIAVVSYRTKISALQPEINNYLIKHNAEIESVHASLVIIHGIGVLIKGKSGIGKSEAVLELIHNNHIFVSDDTVETYKIGTSLYGRPAKITKDFLEARGIGLVNIPYIYGAKVVTDKTKIDLVIELVSSKKMNSVDRLGNQNLTEKIQNCFITKIQIPAGAGRSIAVLIEAAVNVFLAKKEGLEPVVEMSKRR